MEDELVHYLEEKIVARDALHWLWTREGIDNLATWLSKDLGVDKFHFLVAMVDMFLENYKGEKLQKVKPACVRDEKKAVREIKKLKDILIDEGIRLYKFDR